jgi:hypothetical protein
MPDGPKQLTWCGVGRQLGEQEFDRSEARREVVAVVAIAEDGIEPRQVRGATVDGTPDARKASPDPGGIDRPIDSETGRRGRLPEDGSRG